MLNQTFQLLKPGLNHTQDMLNMKARSFNGFPRPWLGLQESNIREIKAVLGNLFLLRYKRTCRKKLNLALSPIVEELRMFAVFHNEWIDLEGERTVTKYDQRNSFRRYCLG